MLLSELPVWLRLREPPALLAPDLESLTSEPVSLLVLVGQEFLDEVDEPGTLRPLPVLSTVFDEVGRPPISGEGFLVVDSVFELP